MPDRWVRQAGPVEALHVQHNTTEAEQWLTQHRVTWFHDMNGLTIRDGNTLMDVRPGQWLVRDCYVGDFTVLSDAEFRCRHTPALHVVPS